MEEPQPAGTVQCPWCRKMLCSRSDPPEMVQEAVRLHFWANQRCQLTNTFWQRRGAFDIEEDS